MNRNPQSLVVIGHGAAGLAAAVSAAEEAARRGLRVEITLVEKSSEDEAGGNTRYSPSYMRLAAPDRLAPGFEDDMQQASGGLADRGYFRTLAENADAPKLVSFREEVVHAAAYDRGSIADVPGVA